MEGGKSSPPPVSTAKVETSAAGCRDPCNIDDTDGDNDERALSSAHFEAVAQDWGYSEGDRYSDHPISNSTAYPFSSSLSDLAGDLIAALQTLTDTDSGAVDDHFVDYEANSGSNSPLPVRDTRDGTETVSLLLDRFSSLHLAGTETTKQSKEENGFRGDNQSEGSSSVVSKEDCGSLELDDDVLDSDSDHGDVNCPWKFNQTIEALLLEPFDYQHVFDYNEDQEDLLVGSAYVPLQQPDNSYDESHRVISELDESNLDFASLHIDSRYLDRSLNSVSSTSFNHQDTKDTLYCLPCTDRSNNIDSLTETSAKPTISGAGGAHHFPQAGNLVYPIKKRRVHFFNDNNQSLQPPEGYTAERELTEQYLEDLLRRSFTSMSEQDETTINEQLNLDEDEYSKKVVEDTFNNGQAGTCDQYSHEENYEQEHEYPYNHQDYQYDDNDNDENKQHYFSQNLNPISTRAQALKEAQPFTNAFETHLATFAEPRPSKPIATTPLTLKSERTCFGNKETIFGLAFSPCGKFVATAGQDSTIRIFHVEKNRLLYTLQEHSREHECLRVAWASSCWVTKQGILGMILASAGADGMVKLYNCSDQEGYKWRCIATLDHCHRPNMEETHKTSKLVEAKETEWEQDVAEEEAAPQIYVLQFIDYWGGLGQTANDDDEYCYDLNCNKEKTAESMGLLMTSSDDYIYLWELALNGKVSERLRLSENDKQKPKEGNLTSTKLMSIQFTHLKAGFGGVFVKLGDVTTNHRNPTPASGPLQLISETDTSRSPFGGDRNPDNVLYVFDASHCKVNNLLGVALSDGTLRLVNGRGVCVSILQLPGCQSHLTAFAWDRTGTRLATCVATGHLVLWSVDLRDGKGGVRPACEAVMEGGHTQGRPLYGAMYCGGKDEDLVLSWGVDGKLCLWDSRSCGQIQAPISVLVTRADYPLYAVDVMELSNLDQKRNLPFARIASGGGREGGFVGVPVYLYDVTEPKHEQTMPSL